MRSSARVRRAECGLLAAFVLILMTSTTVRAHRLDEYLQAAQVAVSADRIAITMSLTPGMAVADSIVSRLDQDGDGRVQPEEAASYGRAMVADLRVRVDGDPLALTLRRIEVPPLPELREGVGSIRIEADAPSSRVGAGSHAVHLENRHVVEGSVYLANALLPASDAIQIRRQQRDPEQQILLIEYDITTADRINIAWLFVAAFLLLALARFRRARLETEDRRPQVT